MIVPGTFSNKYFDIINIWWHCSWVVNSIFWIKVLINSIEDDKYNILYEDGTLYSVVIDDIRIRLPQEVKKNTTIGREIQKYIEAGKLVPDQFVVEMVKLEVKGKDNFIACRWFYY